MKYDDQLADSEMRAYSDDTAYMVYAGSGDEEEFIKKVKAYNPVFDEKTKVLSDNSGFRLEYYKAEDSTQYV